ncbi:TPA: hypothetical protein DIC21_00960, partial [Candidatus Uhrbacteria bacterium]|nr:hypothetical protein [Candidatus Uhrbacteria bacterium]
MKGQKQKKTARSNPTVVPKKDTSVLTHRHQLTPAEARAAVRNHAADKTDTDERPSVAEETDIRSEGIATARAREVDA